MIENEEYLLMGWGLVCRSSGGTVASGLSGP